MNRFDKNFNESDPETGRPFTRGYPDGVWIMGLLTCLFLVITLIGTIWGSLDAWKESGSATAIVGISVSGILVSIVWASLLLFLVKRSAGVIVFSGALAFFALVGGAFGAKASGSGIAGPLVFFAIFMYFAIYAEGLRKDVIIGREAKLNQTLDSIGSSSAGPDRVS